jgi:hypothetical protein
VEYAGKRVSNIPYEKNKNFVGRENVLLDLEICFQNSRRVSLSGIGGVGFVTKTQCLYSTFAKDNAGSQKLLPNIATAGKTKILMEVSSGFIPTHL